VQHSKEHHENCVDGISALGKITTDHAEGINRAVLQFISAARLFYVMGRQPAINSTSVDQQWQ
jgi:hypothetical protein